MTTEFDPTTNRVPFGLLTEQERNVLKEWPHGIEFYASIIWFEAETPMWRIGNRWRESDNPVWVQDTVYRGKPGPVVSSGWFNVYPQGPSNSKHYSRKSADNSASTTRIAVLRIDNCEGVSTTHIEEV
jgi:hypothetical protein